MFGFFVVCFVVFFRQNTASKQTYLNLSENPLHSWMLNIKTENFCSFLICYMQGSARACTRFFPVPWKAMLDYCQSMSGWRGILKFFFISWVNLSLPCHMRIKLLVSITCFPLTAAEEQRGLFWSYPTCCLTSLTSVVLRRNLFLSVWGTHQKLSHFTSNTFLELQINSKCVWHRVEGTKKMTK